MSFEIVRMCLIYASMVGFTLRIKFKLQDVNILL